jgi:CelD/BcsL family acetyltransferase involved in cellulose biosynthesis
MFTGAAALLGDSKECAVPFTAALAGDITLLFDSLWGAGVALTESARKRRTAEACDVSVAEGADAMALAAPAWRDLERAGGASTPFQTHALAQRLAEAHLKRNETPRIVVVHDGGRPVVVLPTVVTRWSGVATVRFLGDPLIQYGDALALPEASDADLDAAWRAAADPRVAQLIYLRHVRADARIAPALARHAAIVASARAPHVDTAASTPSAHAAKELRRLRRRLDERGPVSFEILQGPEAGKATREAIDLKREWLAARGASSAVIGDRDWEAALLALASDEGSPLRMARLSVGGRTAAVEIGLAHDGRWCAFLGALSPEFAKAGPGQVQMADTVAYCRDAGFACYDLMAPADPYKTRIAHGSAAVHSHAAALSPAGWPGLLLARMRPLAKRLAARMPSPARQVIQALRAD